jgi:RNA polymerase sigma factor (sigma-70 family)
LTLDNLVDRQGRPFPGHIQASLNQAIVAALSDPDADVDTILRTAQGIGERAPHKGIVDLVRYMTSALFNASKREKAKRIPPHGQVEISECTEISIGLASNSHKSIEASILLSEILRSLPVPEREVLLRFTYGMQHSEIAKELGISTLASRRRLHIARKRLAERLGVAQ